MKILKLHIALIVLFVGIISSYPSILRSQEAVKKQIVAYRIELPPKIDGILDDSSWVDIPAATNFIQFVPENGKPASFDSEVKFIYDDKALYVGAMLYDTLPDKILKELSTTAVGCFSDHVNVENFLQVGNIKNILKVC